jgi:hypothetical protein
MHRNWFFKIGSGLYGSRTGNEYEKPGYCADYSEAEVKAKATSLPPSDYLFSCA